MCLILFKPDKDGSITREEVAASVKKNSDGTGIMWVEDGRVKVEKLLTTGVGDARNLEAQVDLCMEHFNSKDMVAIHHRLSTDGKDCDDNLHPFKILSIDDGDDRDLYMMHNGMISNTSPGGNKRTAERSDTRILAEDVLTPLLRKYPTLISEDAFQRMLDDFIGASKLLFLDSNGEHIIINKKAGVDRNGCWLSNSHSTTIYTKPATTSYYGGYGQGYNRRPATTPALPVKKPEPQAGETKLLTFTGAKQEQCPTSKSNGSTGRGLVGVTGKADLIIIEGNRKSIIRPSSGIAQWIRHGGIEHMLENGYTSYADMLSMSTGLSPFDVALLLEELTSRIADRDYQ